MQKIQKYLVVVSTSLLICCIGVLFISRSTLNEFKNYNDILDYRYHIVPILGYICGILLIPAAIFGFCSIIFSKNYCVMITFGAMLFLITLFEISLGTVGFMIQSYTMLNHDMLYSMKLYIKGETNIQENWDLLQINLQCCGVNSYKDWLNVVNQTVSNPKLLPISCCNIIGAIGEAHCTIENYLGVQHILHSLNSTVENDGCGSKLGSEIYSVINILGIIGLAFASIHLLQMISICFVARNIKKHQNYSQISIISDVM